MRWRIAVAPALGAALVLAACTPDVEVPGPSSTASTSASPASSPQTTSSATAGPSPDGAENDPGDGIATDEAVPKPTSADEEGVARVSMHLTGWGIEGDLLDAAAVVQGVVAEGTCTLTLSDGEDVLTATGAAQRSAASTDCAAGLAVDVSGAAPGEWELVVSFEAEGYAGATAPEAVTIP